MTVLEVRGLRKAFGGVWALTRLDFDLSAGEMLALIGPNGAGKTTCFNLINGQLKADGGSVRLLGRELLGLPAHRIARQGVGRTFQITATFQSMTVRENVQMALLAHRRRTMALRPRAARLYVPEAEALLERVGMAEQAGRRCAILSYGDLKRVELAMALAGGPRLLLMDEPTAGMSPQERRELMALVSGIARQERTAVLFIEHDMDAVFAHAHRILVLNRGERIAEGSPREVRAHPEVRSAYLGMNGTARRKRKRAT
jgi:branched-chain amino acid transport system ATP-binding protein